MTHMRFASFGFEPIWARGRFRGLLRVVAGLCLFVPGLAAHLAAEDVEFRSSRISLRYNEKLHCQMRWLVAGEGNVVAFDPGVQEGMLIAGREMTRFAMDRTRTSQKRIRDAEFGHALEAVVVGVFGDDEDRPVLERQVRILLPDQFPDAAIFQNTYRNLSSRTLHVECVFSQRVLLDRKLAEPEEPSWSFASFQGGAYKWGNEYALIRLHPDFRQSNFLGVDDVRGPEGVGGGMPFVDVWGPTMGVALAHLEKLPQWLSLPVEVRADRKVELAVIEKPAQKLGQQEWLKAGESYHTVMTSILFHRLDFYDPLSIYGKLLRRRGVPIPETSPAYAYEPYWKSWGWGRDFTVEKILKILPELKAMGINVANLDDGWYDYFGDWQINRAQGKFPGGEPDMVDFVKKVHAQGFKTNLWWYPLGVSPKSRLAREQSELLVQNESGEYPLDIEDLHQLCPAYEPALDHIRSVLTRAISVWGFDGVYTDFQGLSAVPACFNKAHGHRTPLDSFQQMPGLYEMIYTTLHKLKSDPYHEVCICSLPHSPYFMPFYDLASASDPLNPKQVRTRVKLEKGIRGGTYAVGDCYQVPIQEWTGSSVPESFESAVGTGAQLTTFYTALDERQRALWGRWFHEYRDLGLARAEYLNLYDLAFDRPEIHTVRKGQDLYYGIFADFWPRGRRIELRGLDKGTTYEVYDYRNRMQLGTVKGAEPYLKLGFKENLLIRVRPRGPSSP